MAPVVSMRTRKFKSNPLLGRKQFVVDVVHPNSNMISKEQVAEKLKAMYKVGDSKCITTFGWSTAFGGGKSTGFGLIYDNQDLAKKFEPKHRLKKAGLYEASKKVIKKIGRFNYKRMKTALKSLRNKALTAERKNRGAQ